MSERPTLLLDPANPHDWDAGELEQFAGDLEAQIPGVSAVPIRRPEEGYGGPLIEVLHVWQEYSSAVGGVATTAAGAGWIIQPFRSAGGATVKNTQSPKGHEVVYSASMTKTMN